MSFDLSRLTRADRMVAGSGLAFFIFLFFFHWYGVSDSAGGLHISVGSNGWHAFTVARWVWLLTVLVVVGYLIVRAGAAKVRLPIQPSVVLAICAAVSTLLILFRVIHHPSGSVHATVGGVSGTFAGASGGIKIGIWLALFASAALTYAGVLAMGDEGTSIADVREQASEAISNLQSSTGGGSEPTSPAPAAAAPATPVPPAAESPPPPVPPPSGDSAA